MSATIIDGKAIGAQLRAEVAAEVRRLSHQNGLTPGLAVVLVGKNPASEVYVRNKSKAVTDAGMTPIDRHLPESVSETELLDLIAELNADPKVNGILVQLPLPKQIDAQKVIAAIDPAKDVDGFQHSRQTGGATAACRECDSDHRAFEDQGYCRRLPARRHPDCRHRTTGIRAWRLDQEGCHRHRRRHQPRRGRGR
jgi:hypothetical protein